MNSKQTLKQWISFSFLTIFLGISLSIVWYEIPPSTIKVNQVNIDEGEFNITGIAQELIIQDVTKKGVWASRGYDIYFKPNKENIFHRISKVPIPLGLSYLANSRIIRYLLNKQEVLEILVLRSGNIIALGGGLIFRSSDYGHSFTEVAKLTHYGLGKGRGVMPQGYTTDAQGNIYWGEYWLNPNREEIQLMKSKDGGNSWESVYTFEDIRHIHAVQYDPYSDAIWVAVGDESKECSIGYSDDGGKSFTKIGSGSQEWRAVSLIFTKKYVYWGMDGSSEPKILRWNRTNKEVEKLDTLDSYAFYSTTLDNGTMILSTDGTNGEASLWINKDGKSWIKARSWARNRENHHGVIRMISKKNKLIISNINLSYYNNNLLILEL